MLNERRVIQMARMEIQRKNHPGLLDGWLSIERKDYISFHRVIGFIEGSFFYGTLSVTAAAAFVAFFVDNIDRQLATVALMGFVIGYLIFMFFYQKWYYIYSSKRYKEEKTRAIHWRRDWDELAGIYEEEEEAAKPTVDMDVLFPEGSLGEN